jgi:hypothetical protein
VGQRCSRDDVLSLLTLPQSFHTSHKQARGGGCKEAEKRNIGDTTRAAR